tara:strand:- start:324 stop:527 length:204 start_codon:yes stop_codon:yes gene_type:complete
LKVRILQAFQTFKIGQVFNWPDGMANVFVARGLATPVEERSVESADAPEESVERAAISSKPKRRRKK